MKPMTPKQKADYVVQFMAALVASTGNPTGHAGRISDAVKLVDQIDIALSKRAAKSAANKSATKI